MRRPAASSMRSSKSTKRQANWRARSVPMVVLPEPMKPARQSTCNRDCGGRGGSWVIYSRYLNRLAGTLDRLAPLVALQDADCTTVGGELHLGQAAADRAEQALGKFGGHAAHTMRIRPQIRVGLIVDRAGCGLRFEIEGIVP